ncbi:MAG: glycerol-3-phosphate dehydrogenase [Novosphingobium sp.]|nr:glycerol-3-phosphate dehydrogenase [Novosphingobium sp.]
MTSGGNGAFDVAIIGGGINGAGIARDAAGRGARVLLLEAGDLACGTSSKSTKLIHGGLRYLEHGEFALVHEALAEREALMAIAPHLIRPMRFVLPHASGLRPAWLLRAGLFVYDHMGGRKRLPATDTVLLNRHPAGGPLKPGYRIGFEYSDGWVDDARLVVANAVDARERGADIRPRTPLASARRVAGGWELATPAGPFRAAALVNAAGPHVLDVQARAGEAPAMAMRLVRGSHIVVRRLFDHAYAYFFQLPDGRIFFAIPYERDFTLIGTTDADHHGSLDRIEPSEAEVAYLCEGVNRYFAKGISPADVVWRFAGVRPLIEDNSGRPEAATRGYRLHLSEADEGAPLLTVYGGKITTYRHLAEEATSLLARRVPALTGKPWTKDRALPGGDFPVDGLDDLKARIAGRFGWLDAANVDRIARAYGTRVFGWLSDDCGRDLGGGLTEAEVGYLVREEWARTADDVLWRRTKAGLHMTADQCAAVAALLGT